MKTIDESLPRLAEIEATYSQVRLWEGNEAETRRKVIDQMLTEVLGWHPVQDMKYEERNVAVENDEIQYADYVVRTASTAFVVEAKRAGAAFELPQNRKSGKLSGFLSLGQVGEAIRQATSYARELSVPFAVVTNGSSWVVFPAVRTDGVKFEESQAVIFRDLADVKERFVDFWELLSRQRVAEGNLEATLLRNFSDQPHRRLLSIIRDSGYRLGRNSVYEHIEPAVNAAFTDEMILADKEGLKFCYVKTSERVKYDRRLQMHINDTRPRLDRKTVRPRRQSDGNVLDKHVTAPLGSAKKFILILGPVGAGKTTFLQHTRTVSAAGEIDGKVIWIYVDFKKATGQDNPRQFIYRALLDYIEGPNEFDLGDWKTVIKHAYKQYIRTQQSGALAMLFENDEKEFLSTISKEIANERAAVEPYVDKVLTYAAKQYPVYLIIDNADQIEADEFQKAVFLEAQACARRIEASVVISLRESTYAKYKDSPAFDAFQVDALYIDAPQTRPVLSRRFSYAKKVLGEKRVEISAESGAKFVVNDLSAFFDIVSASVLGEKCGYMVEVLSAGDVRRGLRLIREFLASGHTQSDVALWNYVKQQRFTFPPHEFFKGAVFGQRKFYREEDSLIPNIFDSRLGRKNLSLLRVVILSYLYGFTNQSETYEGTPVELITSELFTAGVCEADVMKVLGDLHDFRALRTLDAAPLHPRAVIIITRFGGYLIRELSRKFGYVEPCALDAEIFDQDTWDRLVQITEDVNSARGMERLDRRLDRVRTFVATLADAEKAWLVNAKRHSLSKEWQTEFFSKVFISEMDAELSAVHRSAEKRGQIPSGRNTRV
jgi:hypothetical protein